MGGVLRWGYWVVAYLVGNVAMAWFLLFVAGWPALPRHIDAHPPGPVGPALAIDLALLGLFGLQHSLMARAGFKAWWTKFVPAELERSTYLLASGVVLVILCLGWQSLPGTVWILDPVGRAVAWAVFAFGAALFTAASFAVDHAELMGLAPIRRHLRGEAAPEDRLVVRGLYAWVRHPIQTGILLVLWAAPEMSASRLLLAAGLSVYIFVGLAFEERDLVRSYGAAYQRYRARVPRLLPRPWRPRAHPAAAGDGGSEGP